MLLHYILCFFVSMVPLIELRGAIPYAVGMGLDYFTALVICVVGNMLPVPIIYLFARKVLIWGMDKRYIGKFFTFCVNKGEHAGQKLTQKAGRGGLFLALLLFVGIPLPGTGAWTGTLAASFLDSPAGHRRLDGNPGGVFFGYGLQVRHTGGVPGGGAGGHHHGRGEHDRGTRFRAVISFGERCGHG